MVEDRFNSEQRFRELIDTVPNVAIQGYDQQLVCRFWNAASEALYGYSEAEAIGASLLDLIIPADMRQAVVQATDTMLASGRAIPSGELVLRNKLGGPVHVHSGHVLLQRPGHPAEFFCIDFDLSEGRRAEAERRQIESRLREVQKMEALGTLAGGVAHDFNNILAAILGNVSLALEDTEASSPVRTSLLEIQKSGRRARAITQQILTFARSEREQHEPIAMGLLVEELHGIFRTSLPAATRLMIDVPAGLPLVLANPTQIGQVLINLVNNSVQSTAGRPDALVSLSAQSRDTPPDLETGSIEILRSSCREHRPGVLVTVTDNGTGMAEEVAKRIFEPFFTTKVAQKGTGLGLSVVHGILRDHDASLHLRTAPGQGSRFSFWLGGLTSQPGGTPDPT